ncbi:MAG: right-handed parallel beta-helix repeat-containing protein, partial [Tannerella sp.]|nr:right-handed parallel beta-helix repeat-containing protein [Tannerella sp.]
VIRSERGAKISHLTFENITVRNFTKNGLLIVGASNVKISRCDFSDNGSSVVPGAGFHHNLHLSHVTDVEITGSRFDASPFGNGVALLSSRNVRMTGNEMCRNKRSGIYCADSENVTILNNLAEGNDLDGISLDAMATNCVSVTVRGNLLQHNGRHGMRTVRVARLTESDNTDLFNRYRPAIDVLPAPDSLREATVRCQSVPGRSGKPLYAVSLFPDAPGSHCTLSVCSRTFREATVRCQSVLGSSEKSLYAVSLFSEVPRSHCTLSVSR